MEGVKKKIESGNENLNSLLDEDLFASLVQICETINYCAIFFNLLSQFVPKNKKKKAEVITLFKK